MEQGPWEWAADRGKVEADVDVVAWVDLLRPGQEAIVCVRSAATRNPIKSELPAPSRNVRSAAPRWRGNRCEYKGGLREGL